ncbi:MAG: ABC transporter substrate-binding protein [Synechococcales cyanobacterium RU_4_20]|nr:ABC transporter substrate-binding protein [Synechococcales cyanobacterium RU_4_20]NJR70310.1 ABC transporter substrate-binding protein [Synechococcales cyanobacterium CRU_2_2]
MRRRTVIKSSALLALGAVSTVGLGSCTKQPSNQADSGPTSDIPLRVAMVPWVGWSRAKIAEVQGFFEAEGIKVEQKVYDTVTAANAALVAKEVDLAWVVAADLVVLADEAPGLKFIMACDYSGDVDAIVGRGISGADDARNKTFAREDVPYQIVFLNKYLQSLGLTEKDVKIVSLDVPAAAKALTAGEVDAIAAYEPFVGNILKEKAETKTLFSAKDSNVIINGLVGHSQVLQSRRQDVLAYMRALNQGLDFFKGNPEEGTKIIADWVASTPTEVTAIMEKLNILDLAANKSIAFASGNKLNVANSFDSAVPVLVSAGKATSEVPGISFVDSSFVDAL